MLLCGAAARIDLSAGERATNAAMVYLTGLLIEVHWGTRNSRNDILSAARRRGVNTFHPFRYQFNNATVELSLFGRSESRDIDGMIWCTNSFPNSTPYWSNGLTFHTTP
jgi:hypothetical protein